MNVRIDSFERSIHSIYKLDNFSIQIKKVHIEIQQYITGEDEFNQQYKNDAVSFSSAIKSDILRKQSELVEAITHSVIAINSAHRRCRKSKAGRTN